ncbi:MAG: M12 family metallo-peptidase [Planctomycetota bacterium]
MPVVHELGDPTVAEIPWLPFQCGAEDLVPPDALAGTVPPQQGGLAGTVCQIVQLAIDTDEEYLQLFGGSVEAAQAYLELLVAAADAIHGRDAGVRLQLVYSRLWTSNDPWTASGTQLQLTELREHWQSQMGGVFRDSTHLLSGRDLGGGIAWIGGLCTSYSYGVSANLSGFFPTPMVDHSHQNWDPYVFAHELGHTLGSRHTHDTLHYDPPLDDCWIDDAVGPCSMAWGGTVMSYCHQCAGGLANIALSLHPEVSARISATVGTAACASDGPCVEDCNGNGVADEFDVASGGSGDCDGNGVPDECDSDLDGDGVPDACDVCPSDPLLGVSAPCGCGIAPIDCDGDGIADACEGGSALVAGEAFPLPDGDAVGASGAIVVEASFEVGSVEIGIEGLVHDRLGDLSASLTQVESGRSVPLFVRVGRTGGGGGDNSNLAGDYVFADADVGDFWAAADAANNNGVVPPGRYAATAAGSADPVSLDAVFGGHDAAGTWRLEIADESSGETGLFAGWSLRVIEPDDGVEPCGGCDADLSGNGVVDGEDLGIFLIYWGTGEATADLDDSGVVDAADLSQVLDQWGSCP